MTPSRAKMPQFRLQRLYEEILKLAYQIHADLVPSVTFFDGFLLLVYGTPVIPGQLHISQVFSLRAPPSWSVSSFLSDLAKFVAKSADRPQPESSYFSLSYTQTARNTLLKLSRNEAFERIEPLCREKVLGLLSKVSLLNEMSPVLSYTDFAKVNIVAIDLVNVTGVIDFDDA
ncbi:hypothetical protein EV356DRAFT_512765 [Viridothelium virens]|uniref:Aminoglycoside phosphotransferase domain-containing protein n=1 Tax=Viridothelium virens TaxID=1048519 RepID=A0A6A6HG81_VIRVR|nr:hypothetical protein EV356DRAFT_512765 [Viridothelium virens]